MKDDNYRNLLQREFDLIKSKNKSFSLRSFAKKLDLSATHISLVLLGKKNLSISSSEKIAQKLKWSETKTRKFITLVQAEHSSSDYSKAAALEQMDKIKSRDVDFNTLSIDTFEIISNWYYGAILTALTIKDFNATTKNISERFHLDLMETTLAMKRLQKLNLVKLNRTKWVATNQFLAIKEIPSEAIRKYHKDMLSLAGAALENQSFNEREFSNFTIAVDPERFEEAKKKIKDFSKELFTFMEGENPTKVYQLSVQLFKLD
jgi:uncharacterized protein (TIGR02147 family)